MATPTSHLQPFSPATHRRSPQGRSLPKSVIADLSVIKPSGREGRCRGPRVGGTDNVLESAHRWLISGLLQLGAERGWD